MLPVTNPEVVSRVAVWLNPYELLIAATVSRGWYQAFTGDTTWQHYNVHGVEHVYQDYLGIKSQCHVLAWRCQWMFSQPPPGLYHELAYYRKDGDIVSHRLSKQKKLPLQDRPQRYIMLLAQSTIRPTGFYRPLEIAALSFQELPGWRQKDNAIACSFLRLGVDPTGLADCYKSDREAALASKTVLARQAGNLFLNSSLLLETDVLRHMVAYNERLYHELPEEFRQDPELFKTYLWACERSPSGVSWPREEILDYAPKTILVNKELMEMVYKIDPRLRARVPKLLAWKEGEPMPPYEIDVQPYEYFAKLQQNITRGML